MKKASSSEKTFLIRRDRLRAQFYEIIGELPPKCPLNPVVNRKIETESFTMEAVAFESQPNHHVTGLFYLPALLFVPDGAKKSSPVTIIVNEEGKTAYAAPGGRIREALRQGHIVLSVDITDTGELKDKKRFSASHSEFFTAKFPLYEGKTLLAYRAEDIVNATRFLLHHQLADTTNIRLILIGNTSYAALHAAAISQYFSTVEFIGDLESWEDVATAEFHSNEQLARMDNIVPDVLNFYDIPDLIEMMSGIIVHGLD